MVSLRAGYAKLDLMHNSTANNDALVNNTSPSANRFSRQSFLSVKDDTQNASVCLYQFSALNATSNAGGCAGVFSDQCRDHLQQLLFNETNALYQEGDRCPNVWPAGRESQQHLRDLCGRISGNEWSRESPFHSTSQMLILGKATRFSVPNHTCNYPSLPNVDLPDGYQTPFSSAGMKGLYNFFGDEPASTYDLYTQQVVSFVIVASFEGNQNNAVQFACVTPNSTQAGSRQPAQRPWENSAQDWQIPGRMLVSVAGLVALMLVL